MLSRKLLPLVPLLLFMASCSRDPKAQAQRYTDTGNNFFNKGKYKEAGIMYRRALQKDLRFGEAYYRLALTELKLGSIGAAFSSLRRAVELQPDNADSTVKLATIVLLASVQDTAHQKQLLDDAKDLSAKLVQKDPKSFEGHKIQGQIALVLKDYPTAVKEFNLANAAKPSDPDLSISYFQALAANNQVAEAEKLAREVISKNSTY